MRDGSALEEPDVRDRRGQRDVAHALAAHLRLDDLDAALLADDAAVLHALVLAAVALVVLDRPEDLGAEEAVTLRLERPVVDGLRLLHLAVRPLADLLRRRQRMRIALNANGSFGFSKKLKMSFTGVSLGSRVPVRWAFEGLGRGAPHVCDGDPGLAARPAGSSLPP
jgi:hypothetical protein